MNCRDAKELLHAYVDDELDIVTVRQFDEHLAECVRCRGAIEGVRAVKSAVSEPMQYYKAPAELRKRVLAQLKPAVFPPLPLGEGRGEGKLKESRSTNALTPTLSQRQRGNYRVPQLWWGVALAAAVLLAFGLFLIANRQAENPVIAQVLTAHLRSLQPGHLMDVVSTNQHTVKPWFDTHVDFSPPVKQLAPQFPLEGGRLDYLQDHAVAALIYKHGDHIINLFIWPGESGQSQGARRGFNFLHWSRDGMTFWAVSDTGEPQLRDFAELFQSTSAPTTAPK